MTEHEHGCPCCHPERFAIPETRQNEGHVAVRFGHEKAHNLDVFFEGEHQKYTFEAQAGDPGWVLRYAHEGGPGPLVLCPCHDGYDHQTTHPSCPVICVEQVYGRVELVLKEPA